MSISIERRDNGCTSRAVLGRRGSVGAEFEKRRVSYSTE